jgi:CHAT domain-containing protein
MHTGQEFLCLERPVARMPMGFAFPRGTPQLLPKPGKRRFLLVYADPAKPPSLAAAGKEVKRIQEDLEKAWPDETEIEVLWREQADGGRLNEALLDPDYDVIHYAGHADFDAREPELSGLLLHDHEIFFAEKIHRLLKGRPLVFLNACKSGRTANEEEPQKVKEYLQKPAGGLASYFIYGGARACIGALWPIYDGPAAEFAVEFYNKVLEGHMIGEAMWLARQYIRKEHPNQITWASFVLYGDPTARLD